MRQGVKSLQVRASTVFRGPTRKGKVSEAMNRVTNFCGESTAFPVHISELCFDRGILLRKTPGVPAGPAGR